MTPAGIHSGPMFDAGAIDEWEILWPPFANLGRAR